jgi:hypothetical protein
MAGVDVGVLLSAPRGAAKHQITKRMLRSSAPRKKATDCKIVSQRTNLVIPLYSAFRMRSSNKSRRMSVQTTPHPIENMKIIVNIWKATKLGLLWGCQIRYEMQNPMAAVAIPKTRLMKKLNWLT